MQQLQIVQLNVYQYMTANLIEKHIHALITEVAVYHPDENVHMPEYFFASSAYPRIKCPFDTVADCFDDLPF